MGNEYPPSNTPQAKQPWKVPLNDLSRSWLASPEAQEVLCNVAASGTYSLGTQVAAFEEEFADYLGVSGVVGVASGTDALEIALRTVGCEPGDTIVSVANAGGYTSIAAAQIGVRVRYCDVNPHLLLMSAETLNEVLTPDIKAVVATHLYGNVVDTEPILAMCRPLNIPVVEDCAQATGARYKGRRVGSIGDVAAFSFYPTKNLGGMGDGGAIATSHSEYANVARKLRQYGWGSRYKIDLPGGRNSRLDELQGGLLRSSLMYLDSWNIQRKSIKRAYAQALSGSSYFMVQGCELGEDVAHLAVVACPSSDERIILTDRLSDVGIQTSIHYPVPDNQQPGLQVSEQLSLLTNTAAATDTVITIPLYPAMESRDVDYVAHHLHRATSNV